jgi:hypothetical protein
LVKLHRISLNSANLGILFCAALNVFLGDSALGQVNVALVLIHSDNINVPIIAN